MKSNKRISAGKRSGNPAYRTPSAYRATGKFKTGGQPVKN